MRDERQMEILRERHGIKLSDFRHMHFHGHFFSRLRVGDYILEGAETYKDGVFVWDASTANLDECWNIGDKAVRRLHNWVAATTYAESLTATRRAKDKTP